MLTYHCMRCEILVVYAKNRQVVVHAYVWLLSQVSCLKMMFCRLVLFDGLYTKMQEYMAMLHDVTIVALKEKNKRSSICISCIICFSI